MNTTPPQVDLTASRRQKLSERIAGSLRQDFLSGQVSLGQKLPTETQLAGTFDVSRTVIREAIAALVADGLLETRQGAGIFVIGHQTSGPTKRQDRSSNISHALNVLEVRIALETESAALAATRRNASQEAQIQESFLNSTASCSLANRQARLTLLSTDPLPRRPTTLSMSRFSMR